MTEPWLSASAVIAAPAATVYAILADYRQSRAQILPQPPFEGLAVEAGGVGAGTVIRVRVRLLGQRVTYRATVSEPEPGRVLVETHNTGTVTTFTVEPQGAAQCQVSISTASPPGVRAQLERWLIARTFQSVYAQELERLARLATAR